MVAKKRERGFVLGELTRERWPAREHWPADTAFTPDKVATMLRAAGAPEPWRHPEIIAEIGGLADRLVWLEQEARKPPEIDPLAGERKRAQDAVDELRRVLPALIAETENGDSFGPFDARWWTAKGDGLRRLQDALLPISPEARRRAAVERYAGLVDVPGPHERPWHFGAWTLFHSYLEVVGHGSVDRKGNATGFIWNALTKAGYSGVSTDAVEGVLRRRMEAVPMHEAHESS